MFCYPIIAKFARQIISFMVENLTLNEFYTLYYNDAVRSLKKIEHDYVRDNGAISPYIDIELVRQMTVIYSLERAYMTFDPTKEGAASLHTYLYKSRHNCFRSELAKQRTQMKRNHPEMAKAKDKVRDSITSPAVITGARGAGVDGIKRDPHIYIDVDGVHERKEKIIDRLMECVKKLSPTDQIILDCWMHEKRNYVAAALERLGIENTKKSQSMIRQRFDRAKDRLAKMMGGAKPNYRDVYLPSGPEAKDAIRIEPVERNYARRKARAVKKELSAQIDYKKIAETLYDSDI